MVKPWLAGIAGLLMTSAVAVAQDAPISSSTTTTTTQTNPAPVYQVAPPTTTTVRVDHAASDQNGFLTERTRTIKTEAPTPQVVVPMQTQTTTVERSVTVQPQ